MIGRAAFGCLVVFSIFACSSSDGEGGTAGAGPGAAGGSALSSAGATASSPGAGGGKGGGAPGSAGAANVGGAAASTGGNGATANSGGSGGSSSGGSQVGGGAGQKSTPIPVKDLPVIKEMPDPLTMKDGTKVTTPEQWKVRRQELIQILEDYEYGHMPPPPGNVKASTTTALRRITVSGLEADYRMLHLTFGPGEKLSFDLGLFTPVSSTAADKFPVLISLTSSTDEKSLGSASAALSRGYAVATVPYQKLGADSASWASSAFFPAYPDYDWRDISAWAWACPVRSIIS